MKRYEKLTTEKNSPYYGKSTVTEHILSYDSFSEFVADCHENKNNPHNERNHGYGSGYDEFAGAGYDTAYKFATLGYPEGCKLMRMKLDRLDIASHVKKPEMYFDVTGDYGFDMGIVMSGEPEAFMCYHETEELDIKSKGPVVRILVNTVMSSGIPKDVIAHRGAAVISLVDALESVGKRCQIDVICSAAVYGVKDGNAVFTHKFPLKNAGEMLSIENIAFALSHPAIERRFNFVALGLFPKSTGWKVSKGYGGPMDVEQGDYDIYVPMLHYHDKDWQTVDTTQAWIVKTLHAMGITLDTDPTP